MNKLLQIPKVATEMLMADFWLAKAPNPDTPLLDPQEIADFNEGVYARLGAPEILDLPDMLSAAEVQEKIACHKIPEKPLYGGAGQLLDEAYFARLLTNANPDLPEQIPVRFGLAVRRTSVRYFPTCDVANDEPHELKTDLLQETTIDVGWAVAAVATSRDGQWCFCLTQLYWGWVACADIAFATREVVRDYLQPDERVVTIAPRGLVGLAEGGGATPQMGTCFPLVEETDTVYRVSVPTQSSDQKLQVVDGYINKQNAQFHAGYLPCTLRRILEVAFTLLGEGYAWGGSRLGIFGRDCSRFIKDTYAVTGVTLPRNGSQQGNAGTLQVNFTADMSDDERKTLLLTNASPGDILVLPGHVMLYLGDVDGEPYIIHDMGGKNMCVLVSTLELGAGSAKGSLLQRLTTVASIRGVD